MSHYIPVHPFGLMKLYQKSYTLSMLICMERWDLFPLWSGSFKKNRIRDDGCDGPEIQPNFSIATALVGML